VKNVYSVYVLHIIYIIEIVKVMWMDKFHQMKVIS